LAATPDGLVEEAFAELARRWMSIFDHYAEYGGDIGFELHPCEDLFDAATWKTFLDRENGHKSAMINYDPSHFLLQQMDYLAFSDLYHDRIKAFHVKDAEFNPRWPTGGYLAYQNRTDRVGRFWSGNVVSNQPNKGPPKARLLLPNI